MPGGSDAAGPSRLWQRADFELKAEQCLHAGKHDAGRRKERIDFLVQWRAASEFCGASRVTKDARSHRLTTLFSCLPSVPSRSDPT